jgi:hypothetical protein
MSQFEWEYTLRQAIYKATKWSINQYIQPQKKYLKNLIDIVPPETMFSMQYS